MGCGIVEYRRGGIVEYRRGMWNCGVQTWDVELWGTDVVELWSTDVVDCVVKTLDVVRPCGWCGVLRSAVRLRDEV